MKKRLIASLTVLMLVITVFPVIAKENPNKLYVEAIQEKNPVLKLQKLERWLQLFGNDPKQKENLKYVYLHLFDASYRLKKCGKTIKYAEEALKQPFTDFEKVRFYIAIAQCSRNLGNYDKALQNIDTAISLLEGFMKTPPQGIRKSAIAQLLGESYYTKADTLYRKGEKLASVDFFIKSEAIYKKLGGKKQAAYIHKRILKIGQEFFQAKKFSAAAQVLCPLADRDKIFELYYACAKCLEAIKKPLEQYMSYYKKAYEKKKSAALAYKIGRTYALLSLSEDKKKIADVEKADVSIKYLAEAVALNTNAKVYEAAKRLLQAMLDRRYLGKENKPSLENVVQEAKKRLGIK